MKRRIATDLACLALAMTALSASAEAQTAGPSATSSSPFTLSSPDIKDGTPIDRKFGGPTTEQMACGGENVSPALQWSNPPPNTKSFAVIMYDFEGGRGAGVVHWIAYGIGSDVTSLAAGEGNRASSYLVAGVNSRQLETYFGPCAPATDIPHHYIYSIYALDMAKNELPPKLTREQFLEKAKGRILNLTSIVGTYKRP